MPVSDATVLKALEASAPARKARILTEMLTDRRYALVLRALREGLLDPKTVVDVQGSPQALIHLAANGGAVELLRCLVHEFGVDRNAPTTQRATPLHHAIAFQQTRAALFLADTPGVDPDARAARHFTPLMQAADWDMVQVMRALLARGADIDASDERDFTPVLRAAQRGQEAAAVVLLEAAHVAGHQPAGRGGAGGAGERRADPQQDTGVPRGQDAGVRGGGPAVARGGGGKRGVGCGWMELGGCVVYGGGSV